MITHRISHCDRISPFRVYERKYLISIGLMTGTGQVRFDAAAVALANPFPVSYCGLCEVSTTFDRYPSHLVYYTSIH